MPASGRARQAILVSMPFMDINLPSIQLGLLKSLADANGFAARTLHANLRFAARIGVDYYQLLAQHRGRMLGEWLFSREAFQGAAPDPDARMLDELAGELSYLGEPQGGPRERLLRTRDVDVPGYLDELVNSYPWDEAAIVGFSSTFQQNTASFALARRLKERHPELCTVFGGANFDEDMGPELVRAVGCIDVAVIGEGDETFPRLLTALAAGADLSGVPGIAYRAGGEVIVTPRLPPFARLDDLPLPDYGEYFDSAEELGILARTGTRKVWLPIETSRGCWWGEKHHCTFCGLNAGTMRFRSKSPQRVLGELAEQARRYRSFHFEAVDNILDMAYMKSLIPALADGDWGYQLFYEVKANLTREQLRLMAQAGITAIQPGLESLSSNVLRLMRKGVSAAQNVNLLRWAQHYGISVSWNLLWGFPGETEHDYAEQAEVIPHLLHLQPPVAADRIWLERFSPLFAGEEGAQVRDRRPEQSYRFVYPETVDLDRVAYFFEYRLDGGLPDSAYAGIRQAVAAWAGAWQAAGPPALAYRSAPHFIQISDRRGQGKDGTYTFEDTLADLYLGACDKPTTAEATRRKLGLRMPAAAIQEIFEDFRQRGLMFLDGDHALALALPAGGFPVPRSSAG
jgi:ribosomal peptide maturation radical SAM protein 1